MKKVAAAFVLLFVIVLGLSVWSKKQAATSPTISISLFDGKRRLSTAMGEATVRVYSIRKDSTSFLDAVDIRTTRVELSDSSRNMQSLVLPSSVDLAATRIEFVHLISKEREQLLLLKDNEKVAVVFLSEGRLTFRPELDVLSSWAFDVGPVKLEKQTLGFVSASSYSQGGSRCPCRNYLCGLKNGAS